MTTPLNPQQLIAVQRTGQNVCVVAGPGSGKTRVLTERFAWLVEQGAASPDRILTVTFTEKAAREIKSRLFDRFEANPEIRTQVEGAYVSTIHGFCTRLLRENALAAGVDIGFGVLDEPDSRRHAHQAAVQALDELLAANPADVRRLMESIAVSSRKTESVPDLPGVLVRVYDAMRAAGGRQRREEPPATGPVLHEVIDLLRDLTAPAALWNTPARQRSRAHFLDWIADAEPAAAEPDLTRHLTVLSTLSIKLNAVPREAKPELKRLREILIPKVRATLLTEYYGPLRTLLWEALGRLDALYRERKLALASLDFSDLEERALELFDSAPNIRDRVRSQFDYILMDELQDTNPLQWRILDRIRRPERFFGVGDINQSIYGFRNADPGLFRDFEQSTLDRGETVDRLETNYRTRQQILDAIAWMVRDEPGIVPPNLVSGGRFADPAGPPVEILVTRGDNRDEAVRREAQWIAQRIARFAAGGVKLHQIAVLGRKMRSLEPVAEALRDSGIASITTGGQTLYETRESRDLLLALNVLGNAADEVSLAGLLRSPMVGCRDETLLRLRLLRPTLWAAIASAAGGDAPGFPDEELDRIRWFHRQIARLRSHPVAAPDIQLARFLDACGYLDGLDPQGRANVERFLRRLRDRSHASGESLAAIAAEMQQLRQEAPEAEAPPAEANDAVSLMSIHASKGLEFPIVFVPALSSPPSSDIDPICRSPEHGIAIRWRDPVTGKNQGDLAYEALKEAQAARQSAEEWRLLYVAMTRAESHLILSWPTADRSHGSDWTKKLTERLGLPDSAPQGEILRDERSATPVLFTTLGGDEHPSEPHLPAPAPPAQPMALAPPTLSGQHDAVVSVTELATFAECPRQYYLRHYLGFEDPLAQPVGDGASPGGAETGTQVHQLLAGVPTAGVTEEAARLARAARDTELVQRAERSARRRREYGFNVVIDDVVVRGQIDLMFEEGGQRIIVDYKTDRLPPADAPDRVAHYQLQLRLYAIALEQLDGTLPDRAALLFLRHGEIMDVSLAPEELEAATAVVRDLRRAQQDVNFPLREGERCQRCPFAGGLCPAGSG